MRVAMTHNIPTRCGRSSSACSRSGAVLALPGVAAAQAPAADVQQGRRADLPGEVRGVSSARLDRADVARDLPGDAPVGARDQGPGRGSHDAALGHRQDRRRPEVQERSLAHRRRSRDDRPLGGRRRAAGRPEGHARRPHLARGSGLELRRAVRAEGARHDHQVALVHHAGAVAGRVGQAHDARRASPSRAGCAPSRSGRPP